MAGVDRARGLVIAIDGTAASGKSTTARRVARQLGYLFIDTGAMYRAVALKALERGVSLRDAAALGVMVKSTEVALEADGEGGARTILDGRDVSEAIRRPEVSEGASLVSTVGAVRRRMVELQRGMGAGGRVVAEGRDIGSVVFPQAEVKIYMDASLAERARRRRKEEEARDVHRSQQVVEEELRRRDERDSRREDSPLVCAPGARVLDTTRLSIEEQTEQVLAEVRRHLR